MRRALVGPKAVGRWSIRERSRAIRGTVLTMRMPFGSERKTLESRADWQRCLASSGDLGSADKKGEKNTGQVGVAS